MAPVTLQQQHVRPFKAATKSILLQHLSIDRWGPIKGVKIFGVHIYSANPDDLIVQVNACLKGEEKNSEKRSAIQAAEKLYQKGLRLDHLISNHPAIERVPMFNWDSTTEPLPEDREINDLLLEASTLKQMHKEDYLFLLMKEPNWKSS